MKRTQATLAAAYARYARAPVNVRTLSVILDVHTSAVQRL